MAMKRSGSGRRWIVVGAIAVGTLFSFMFISSGCNKESGGEKAGREAREAYEKSKELVKEGLEKGGEAAKEGLAKSQEAAKDFQKGWQEGAKK